MLLSLGSQCLRYPLLPTNDLARRRAAAQSSAPPERFPEDVSHSCPRSEASYWVKFDPAMVSSHYSINSHETIWGPYSNFRNTINIVFLNTYGIQELIYILFLHSLPNWYRNCFPVGKASCDIHMPGSIEPWEPAKYPKTLRHLKAGADGDVSDIAEFPTLVFDGETSAMFYAIVRR